MLVQFSKCDFWIPEQILDFNIFFRKSILFFRNRKKILKVFENPWEELPTTVMHWVIVSYNITITQCITVVGSSSHGFSNAFKIFFDIEKNNMFFPKNILKSKICSGIQKSYLENRTIIIKSFKLKNPLILTQIPGFPYDSVWCYVHRPLNSFKEKHTSHVTLKEKN